MNLSVVLLTAASPRWDPARGPYGRRAATALSDSGCVLFLFIKSFRDKNSQKLGHQRRIVCCYVCVDGFVKREFHSQPLDALFFFFSISYIKTGKYTKIHCLDIKRHGVRSKGKRR